VGEAFQSKRIGTEMKRLLAATIVLTACLFPYPNLSPPSLASVGTSYCDLEAIRETEIASAAVTNVYVSETNGAVLEVCVTANDAKLSITEQGEMTLLQRDPAFEVDYYTSGFREDRIRRIGIISFDYYTSGFRAGKIKRIGGLNFDYYKSGNRAGKLKQMGSIRFDYYTGGLRDGKLERIGSADIDYDEDGRIETDRTLSNINITIVDFVDNANTN